MLRLRSLTKDRYEEIYIGDCIEDLHWRLVLEIPLQLCSSSRSAATTELQWNLQYKSTDRSGYQTMRRRILIDRDSFKSLLQLAQKH
jgi:hypothetical protein